MNQSKIKKPNMHFQNAWHQQQKSKITIMNSSKKSKNHFKVFKRKNFIENNECAKKIATDLEVVVVYVIAYECDFKSL